MANKLIDQFPAAQPLSGAELLLAWQNGGTVVVTPDQVIALVPAIPAAPVVSATGDYSVAADENATQFDNYGADAAITFSLPPWQAGLSFGFAVVEAETVTIAANGSDEIALAGLILASALSSATPYCAVTLQATNAPGVWVVRAATGAWE
jgi:hypothetical protein